MKVILDNFVLNRFTWCTRCTKSSLFNIFKFIDSEYLQSNENQIKRIFVYCLYVTWVISFSTKEKCQCLKLLYKVECVRQCWYKSIIVRAYRAAIFVLLVDIFKARATFASRSRAVKKPDSSPAMRDQQPVVQLCQPHGYWEES